MSEPTVDRSLNEFPEHLLVHLLSLLPTADAIRTSSLSKKWRDLWSSVSSLNFDFHTRFPPEDSTEATRRQFADFVDRSLLLRSRNSPLRKLRFSFDFREPMYQFHIDSWIRYALAHNANEIEFDFYMEPAYHTHSEFIDCSYEFSFSLLRNGSLQILRICRCVMILPLDMGTMRFKSIRALYLDQILLTDEMVVDLFSGCPNLDTFSLDNCYGMKKLKICSNRLKRLLLLDFYSQNEEEEETLEISTPQLCYIRIKRIEMVIVSFKETPTLVEANVIFLQDQKHYKYWNNYIRLFKGVQRLTTQNFWFKMSNITKLEFAPLDISGKNYLSWILDTKLHLSARSLGKTIVENNTESEQDRSKALIFLRHHIHDGLKVEYLNVEDPLVLWNSLKERYEHLKNVILPQVRYEWTHLRFQDFKSVSAYNSALFRITSMMKLCDEKITNEEMLEKTLSTFHTSNVLLQQQYRERGFAKYSELISCLLLAEQHREILMKNHEQRPTGSAPLPEVSGNAFPEANAIVLHGQNNPCGRGRGRGNGRRRGRGHGPNNDLGHVHSNISKRGANRHNRGRNSGKMPSNAPVIATRDRALNGNACHRCGASGHWFCTCRMPRHLVDLYTASQKGKLESNLVEFDAPLKDFNVDDLFSTGTDFDAVTEGTQDF